jgi:putative endopeptidase
MRRRDFLMILGGAIGGLPLRAPGQDAATAGSEFGNWGFDLGGADLATLPGNDFFRYCNGTWYDRTVIAPDRDANGVDRVLEDRVDVQLREVLEHGEEGVEESSRADAAKIHRLYSNFMDEGRAEALDIRPLVPVLERVRSATSRDELAFFMGSSAETFLSSIFDLGIEVDAKSPDKYAVKIGQGGLGLPDRDYYVTAAFAEKKRAYIAYVARLLGLIGWQRAQAQAAAILRFESAIAEVSWSLAKRRNSEKTYHPVRVSELAKRARFPWREFLRAARLQSVDRVVLGEDTAIIRIAAIWAATPIETLKAWQAFRVVDDAAPFLSARFVEPHFEFRRKTLGGVAQQLPRWKRGIGVVEAAMGEAVGRAYVARHFPPEAKIKVDALVARIRLAFGKRIERVPWMSAETKAKALHKLARLNVKIGYPNKWRDYSNLDIREDDLCGNMLRALTFEWLRKVTRLDMPVDRDEWAMTPQTINAYYDPTLNEMVFPAAYLQPPYFDPKADPAINYRGIGATIGHELTHGFDDDGRKFDAAGALTDWWTKTDVREFTARAAALGRQYDAFEPFPGTHVKGELTMGENIADLGGALIALDAYRNSLEGTPAPILDGFTGEQRFFLAYAQSFRTKRREDALRLILVSDAHAPEQFRVNGVVRNIDAWYGAFGVETNSKLFLAGNDRVRIW